MLSDVLVDVGYSVNVYQLSAIWIDSPLASGKTSAVYQDPIREKNVEPNFEKF